MQISVSEALDMHTVNIFNMCRPLRRHSANTRFPPYCAKVHCRMARSNNFLYFLQTMFMAAPFNFFSAMHLAVSQLLSNYLLLKRP